MNETFDLHLNFVCCQKKIKKNKNLAHVVSHVK